MVSFGSVLVFLFDYLLVFLLLDDVVTFGCVDCFFFLYGVDAYFVQSYSINSRYFCVALVLNLELNLDMMIFISVLLLG